MDAQGPEKARPYVERANPSYANAVDEENLLGQLYGFKAIPNGFLVDENGVLNYMEFGGFDIRKPETYKMVSAWAKATTSEAISLKVDEKPLERSISGPLPFSKKGISNTVWG